MQAVIIIVWATATLGAALYTIVPPLKRLFFPRSLAHEASDAAGRELMMRAECVVRHGVRTILWPVFGLGFVAALVADRASQTIVAGLILSGAIVIGVAWHMVAIPRWWQWAGRQDVDMSLVEELAEDAKLVWGHHTWLGRRQQQTWRQLPPGRAAL